VYDRTQVIEERVNGSVTTRVVQGKSIDMPLAEVRSGAAVFLLQDHLGSITEETNVAGAVMARRRYDPWGRVVSGGVPKQGYAGRWWAPELGAYDNRSRFYSPEFGRFLSEDSIGLGGGINRYAYVENNPLVRRDPFGTSYDTPNMNDTEKKYCFESGPAKSGACGIAKNCMESANTLEHGLNWNRPGGQSDNDRNNALKHCFWACCIAQGAGRSPAIEITDNHEADQRKRQPCPSQMDRHNNMQGIALGSANPDGDCLTMCDKSAALQCAPKKKHCRVGE
jgi:RHS repeat-associated protein